jgi:hypothetical protein
MAYAIFQCFSLPHIFRTSGDGLVMTRVTLGSQMGSHAERTPVNDCEPGRTTSPACWANFGLLRTRANAEYRLRSHWGQLLRTRANADERLQERFLYPAVIGFESLLRRARSMGVNSIVFHAALSASELALRHCGAASPDRLLADHCDPKPLLRGDEVGLVVVPLVKLDPVDGAVELAGLGRIVVAHRRAVVDADIERLVP